MFNLKKSIQIIYGSCLSAFACLILGLMQYIQCRRNGFFYSEGFSIRCNYFYEYGLLLTSGILAILAVSVYFIYAQFKNDENI